VRAPTQPSGQVRAPGETPPRTVCPVRIIPGVALTAAALTVAGCGASPSARQAADASAAETVFRSYHQALLARDFPTACGLFTTQARTELVSTVNDLGGHADTCEQALGTLYATPVVARRYDEASRSLRVQDVQVDGDDAVVRVSYSGGAPVDTTLRRLEGQWRLLTPPRS